MGATSVSAPRAVPPIVGDYRVGDANCFARYAATDATGVARLPDDAAHRGVVRVYSERGLAVLVYALAATGDKRRIE